jgi:hypothetical protein
MNKLLSLLTAAVFAFTSVGSATAAMPKAAEDEAASVVVGADAPRPRRSKAKSVKAPSKKHGKKAKSGRHGKKKRTGRH